MKIRVRFDCYKKETGKWYAGGVVTIDRQHKYLSQEVYDLIAKEQKEVFSMDNFIVVTRNVDDDGTFMNKCWNLPGAPR